ncbi:MAG: Glu/Leu/Phe/Val dehydrogenase [Acidimicrobiia bacterium]|nr:Glu/Leu/Phe/Val dehydrogenase [Acidimicrobiia bacterium]
MPNVATIDPFSLSDDLGPAKVVHLTERRTGLRAVVVVDNVAAGQAIGGTRMALDASAELCFRLARAMTLKNAMAGLRHGGAKSVIIADPKQPLADKERLVRAFAAGMRDLTEYAPGPDMGTDEQCMAWIRDEIGRAVGLPPELGGLPLDQLGATGFGLAVAADVAADRIGLDLDGARVVVQGYGSVGRHAARFLSVRGCVLVGASDSRGGVSDPDGLDLDRLDELKAAGRSVREHAGQTLEHGDEVGVPCDIWVPAAGPDVLRSDNIDNLTARLVLQGANLPATAEAEHRMHERGVLSLPDFVANAGGVICGAVEYAGGTRTQAFDLIAERVAANTAAMLEESDRTGVEPRGVAMEIARARVERAMTTRRWV